MPGLLVCASTQHITLRAPNVTCVTPDRILNGTDNYRSWVGAQIPRTETEE
jgi:hypothetical protein